MKTLLMSLVVVLSLGLASADADAARRFGGGGNLGKQRPAPTMREAPSATPAKPAQAAPAAAPAATPALQPKPSFMSRFGGLLAGLGIGALLGSLFGGHLGGMGGIFMLVLLALAGFMIFRAMSARRNSAEAAPRPAFAGIGSNVPENAPSEPRTIDAEVVREPAYAAPLQLPPDFNRDAFLRVARTSFIRLQAANDAKDLDDIRDYTTPEMYAEISMQLQERGDEPQKTEVTSLEAQLVDYAREGDYEIASVRFYGLIREAPQSNPEPFDEIWHVRKKAADTRSAWLIAGIQQTP